MLVACQTEKVEQPDKIEFNLSGMKTIYFIGESIDLGDSTFTRTAGDTSTTSPITAEMVAGFDTATIGEKTLTVTVGEFSTKVDISVFKITSVEQVSFNMEGFKTEYYIGEKIDIEHVKVKLVDENGVPQEIPATSEMVTGFSSDSIKDIPITIAWRQYSIVVEISIIGYKHIDFYATAGTLPTLYAGLNIINSTNDAYLLFERTNTLNIDKMPEKVKYAEQTDDASATEQVIKMSKTIKAMYEENNQITFHLYADDIRCQRIIQFMIANGIPQERYTATLLSDGTATYSGVKDRKSVV